MVNELRPTADALDLLKGRPLILIGHDFKCHLK